MSHGLELFLSQSQKTGIQSDCTGVFVFYPVKDQSTKSCNICTNKNFQRIVPTAEEVLQGVPCYF